MAEIVFWTLLPRAHTGEPLSSETPNIGEFPKIRGGLFAGPYNKDPTIKGTIFGSPIFGNSLEQPLHISRKYARTSLEE